MCSSGFFVSSGACVVSEVVCVVCFFLMRRRPPRSTQSRSSAASDVYKRQAVEATAIAFAQQGVVPPRPLTHDLMKDVLEALGLSLIHISEPTRPY